MISEINSGLLRTDYLINRLRRSHYLEIIRDNGFAVVTEKIMSAKAAGPESRYVSRLRSCLPVASVLG